MVHRLIDESQPNLLFLAVDLVVIQMLRRLRSAELDNPSFEHFRGKVTNDLLEFIEKVCGKFEQLEFKPTTELNEKSEAAMEKIVELMSYISGRSPVCQRHTEKGLAEIGCGGGFLTPWGYVTFKTPFWTGQA